MSVSDIKKNIMKTFLMYFQSNISAIFVRIVLEISSVYNNLFCNKRTVLL